MTGNHLIEQAEAELADIEQQLAAVEPLRPRREQLRSWLSLTRQVYPNAVPAALQASALPVPAAWAKAPAQAQLLPPAPAYTTMRVRRSETQKDRVASAAMEIIMAEGPMLSRQIVERLKARGVEVGGADVASVVSSILSRNEMFKSDRAAGGWVLIQPHKEVTPPSAPTLAGS